MVLLTLGGLCLAFAFTGVGQTRADLASRFGTAQSEIFVLPNNLKLTATYGVAGSVCAYRIETRDHSERAAPNLTDLRYWTDSNDITRLIADLVPANARRGPVESRTVGLRIGEHMLVESDETVQITRIQRYRRLLIAPDVPVADRLVRIVFRRPECRGDQD